MNNDASLHYTAQELKKNTQFIDFVPSAAPSMPYSHRPNSWVYKNIKNGTIFVLKHKIPTIWLHKFEVLTNTINFTKKRLLRETNQGEYKRASLDITM